MLVEGTIAPNGVSNVSLFYDASQINFQGIYTADVLLTTDAQPIAKVRESVGHEP